MKVTFDIDSCTDCPFFKITGGSSTDGFDWGDDWFCTKAEKRISPFVEWRDKPDIPEWCPIISQNEK